MKWEEIFLRFRKEIILGLILLGVILSFNFVKVPLSQKVNAQQSTTTVGITAIVEAWLVFSVTPTSAFLSPPLVQADGTLNIGSSTEIVLNLGTNATNGWGITIKGQNGGLYSTSTGELIPTVSGTSTLVAGTDGYGANATSTLAGVTIGNYYNYYDTNTVGEIVTSTSRTLASKSTSNSTQSVAKMKVKAATTAERRPAANYSDTIVLTATANL